MNNKKLEYRRELFTRLLPPIKGKDNRNDVNNLLNTCPSCGYPSLSSRCSFEICPICDWEDDGQDDKERNDVWGGPNGSYSLKDYSNEFFRKLEIIKTQEYSDHLLKEIKTNLLILENIENNLDENNIVAFMNQFKKLIPLFNEYKIMKK